ELMPMQPKPSADTPKPSLPNIRFCMASVSFRSRQRLLAFSASAVLLVDYVFQPIDGFAVELFLDGDVHERRRLPCVVLRRHSRWAWMNIHGRFGAAVCLALAFGLA